MKCQIIKSKGHMLIDQNYHILKITAAYFKNNEFLSTETPFRTDRRVESEIDNTNLSLLEKNSNLLW